MKQPKKLTYEQKKMLSANGLNAKEWSFLEDWETKIVVINKVTGAKKAVSKKGK